MTMRGCVHITSIEGKRPPESVRPTAAELMRWHDRILAALNSAESGTGGDS